MPGTTGRKTGIPGVCPLPTVWVAASAGAPANVTVLVNETM